MSIVLRAARTGIVVCWSCVGVLGCDSHPGQREAALTPTDARATANASMLPRSVAEEASAKPEPESQDDAVVEARAEVARLDAIKKRYEGLLREAEHNLQVAKDYEQQMTEEKAIIAARVESLPVTDPSRLAVMRETFEATKRYHDAIRAVSDMYDHYERLSQRIRATIHELTIAHVALIDAKARKQTQHKGVNRSEE
jgi:chromosome segregation ATPase